MTQETKPALPLDRPNSGFDSRDGGRPIAFGIAAALLLVGLPALGIYLAIVTGNPWWLWLIAPLMALMEAGLFAIAVILMVVWSIMGV